MEVTRDNFEAVLPHFLSSLSKCEFLSLDLEFTGIRIPGTTLNDPSCTAAECFQDRYDAAHRYTIIQVGLCLFHPKGSASPSHVDPASPAGSPLVQTQFYDAEPFNFYVFPGEGDLDIGMNVETVREFLLKHGMDFGKWIAKGIPYLRYPSAQQRRDDAAASSPKNVHWKQEMLAEVDKMDSNRFTDAMVKARMVAEGCFEGVFKLPYFQSKKSLQVFERFLSHLGLTKVPDKGSPTGKGNIPIIVKYSPELDLQLAETTIGFTRVIEAVSSSKKPVVAHNSFSDFLFLHACFVSTPLKSLKEFKTAMNAWLPKIFDTRCLATLPQLPFDPTASQNLEGMFQSFRARHRMKVEVNLPLAFISYSEDIQASARAHEAAYDALITGKLFLYLCFELGDGTIPSLNRWKGMIPVYRCLETIHLTGSDAILHDGPILLCSYPPGALTTTKVHSALHGTGLAGRVVWNADCAHVFAPKESRGTLFDSSLKKAQERILIHCEEGKFSVLRQ